MRILLWRHGRTAWNELGRFQGHADPPLDATGRAQARLVAPAIRALAPDVVVSSDLLRCRTTAAELGLTVQADPRLREISLGEWSGLTARQAAERFPAEAAAWHRGEDVRRGGGETYEEVGARAIGVVEDLVASGLPGDDGLAVLVLHGGTARALIGRLLDVPPSTWWHFGPLGNCRWSLLRRSNGRFRLLEHNSGPLAATRAVPRTDAPRAASAGPLARAAPPTLGASAAPDIEPVHSPSTF
ncbi:MULTISPECIES: histidine phosphatase family protein [Protofrankia]|uniref:Phosphoglycerate mutase n=1 Tax=Candidatus Protofrankia datiscae TaxID=2716812 RepID=F8B3S0_9ACTN|nr:MULTISPECIES: histidine phosphatase family protein [Protofrankia]AEH09015.1 Phosphoglycerate mutase [Candidatus Protofrankia datiscae]